MKSQTKAIDLRPEQEPSDGDLSKLSELPLKNRLRLGNLTGAAVVGILLACIAYQLITNPAFQWDVVFAYFIHGGVIRGLLMTIQLTALTMVIGTILGVVLAVMRLSKNPLLVFASASFVWFFRGTPALVQLVFWFNLATLFPTLSVGIPFGGPVWASWNTNDAITPFLAALLGLGLNEAAYMAEIVRAGIQSVDSGQKSASTALGMTPSQTMRRIILPQAMRAIIPPTGNQVIGMLKYTSLASVVALSELLHAVQDIYSVTFQTIPLLIVASIWYLVLTTILSIGQYYIERHYSRGVIADGDVVWGRLLGGLVRRKTIEGATDVR